MKKNSIDAWFNDLRDFRPLFPELSDLQIETLLIGCWFDNDKTIAMLRQKSVSTIRKQKMLIAENMSVDEFAQAKEIARFRISVISFINIRDVRHK